MGFVKINIDGAWRSKRCQGGVGEVVRDGYGQFLAFEMCSSAPVAEAAALRCGPQLGIRLGLAFVMVEGDSQLIANMINRKIEQMHEVAVILGDIQALQCNFQICSFDFGVIIRWSWGTMWQQCSKSPNNFS